jgi:4-hydroxy-tetrahydrodipicolinate synthase
MSQSRLQGIFTPNLVPYSADGGINEGELRRYVDWLIERGVHGLYPNGSTGEFTRFTPEERRRIVAIIADQTRGRVPILAGAAEANVKETLAACEYYASIGVRAVAIVAPFYYKLSPASVYAYFKEIGDNTPIDVTLYNIPMFASPIDVPTVQRLSEECERIVAIKDSSGEIPHMIRMIQAVRPNRPDFAFLTGWDAALMPMLPTRVRVSSPNSLENSTTQQCRANWILLASCNTTCCVCLTRCSIRLNSLKVFAPRLGCEAFRWGRAGSRCRQNSEWT